MRRLVWPIIAACLALAACDGARSADLSARWPNTTDKAQRLTALLDIERSCDAGIAMLALRERRWSWVPVYGLILTLTGDRQRDELVSLRARAETARILAEEGREGF